MRPFCLAILFVPLFSVHALVHRPEGYLSQHSCEDQKSWKGDAADAVLVSDKAGRGILQILACKSCGWKVKSQIPLTAVLSVLKMVVGMSWRIMAALCGHMFS